MPSLGKNALGTTISWAGTTIAELDKIGGIEISADAQEITTLGDSAKTYISGLPDGGEVTIEGFFYPGDTNGQVVLKNAVGGAVGAVVITFPSAFAASWGFNALVTKFSTGDVEIEGGLRFTATLKVTGLPSLSITASTGLTTPFFAVSDSAVVNPTKSGSVYTYTASVLTAIASVTVTPTATAGVITVNGNVVTTGVASSPIALGSAGSVNIITIVVTETGKVPKTYTMYLTRL